MQKKTKEKQMETLKIKHKCLFQCENRFFYENKQKKGTKKKGETQKKDNLRPSEVAALKPSKQNKNKKTNQENKQTKTNKEG